MQLIQPNVVGNFLQSYSAAQDRKREQEEAQYNRQRQMRADERDERRFSFDMDEAQFRKALQRKDLIARSAFALDTEEKWNASVPQLMQQLGIEGPPPSFADRGRIIAEAQTVGEQLEQQFKERQFKLSERVANANITQSLAAAGASNRANRGGGAAGQIAQRADLAAKYNLDVNTPQGQSYILTGKMPAPLSVADRKTIQEADGLVMSTKSAVDMLTEARKLSDDAYEGFAANARAQASALIGSEEAKNTIVFDNLLQSQVLPQLKAIFGGAITEGERQVLFDLQGSSSLPKDVRNKIIDRAIQMAQQRVAFYERQAGELRSGTYYNPRAENQAQGAVAQPPAAGAANPKTFRYDANGNRVQ
jgi:hypothetical protein